MVKRLNDMAEQFRVIMFDEPKAPWRNTHAEAMDDAKALKLASWDASAREWFLSAPVDIEKQGTLDPMRGYPSRPARHREAWNAEDVAKLRRLARGDTSISEISRQLGRSQEACATKARQLGIAVTRAPRRR